MHTTRDMRREAAYKRMNKQTNKWIDGWMNEKNVRDCRSIVLCFGNVEIQNDFLYAKIDLIESPKINQSDEMIHLD